MSARRLGLALAGLALAGPVLAAPEWRLMARHGECHPLAVLARKLPDAAAVRTPQDLAALLKQQGLAFTQTDRPAPGAERSVAFEVPAKGLNILLVTPGLCGPTR
ncbi:hypothetical protein HNQ51_002974 [Inhella inkyongensis]|uniref:Uncharacterized protein n=1 Tax=Inhella inkyongensis TaxID=392593 RepID=A0A840S358_9BURK|nr:hypothetical protein [Inhella inkyongensis]MBB5205647.1 hypothetical protein [Inhella inkyongensis]